MLPLCQILCSTGSQSEYRLRKTVKHRPTAPLAEKYNLVTIVVSPLIALMNDQVDQLQRERGISIAACINSSMSIEERGDVIEQIHIGGKNRYYILHQNYC